MALLEADVNFKVARDFIERVKTKSLGAGSHPEHPARPADRQNHPRRTGRPARLDRTPACNFSGNPSCILMVGLHGSGKTTSSGKLARLLHKQGRAAVARGGGRLSPGGHGPARDARQTTRHAGLRQTRRDGRAEDRPRSARLRAGEQSQHAHLRHRRPAADRRAARAGTGPAARPREAAGNSARARRRHRPGSRERRHAFRPGAEHHRRDPHQARRRRARRRGA